MKYCLQITGKSKPSSLQSISLYLQILSFTSHILYNKAIHVHVYASWENSLSLSRPDICNGAFWRTCLVIKPMLKEKPILFGFLFWRIIEVCLWRLTFDVSFTTKPPQDSICSHRASINIGFYILAYVINNYVHVNIFFSVYMLALFFRFRTRFKYVHCTSNNTHSFLVYKK